MNDNDCISFFKAVFGVSSFGDGVENFDEIFKLKSLLEDAKIPFEFDMEPDKGGYHISYPSSDLKDRVCSVVLHSFSYGRESGLLEIMGLLTDDELKYDTVVGYLDADDVFKRIEKHFLNMNSAEKEEV